MRVRAVISGIALCALLAVASNVNAQSARTTSAHSGDYLTFLMIGSVAEVDDVTATGGGTLQERNTEDTTAAPGLAIGYNWAKKGLPIRSEIEYHYRVRFDFDTRIVGTAGYENQLSTHALLVNAYYDYQLSDTWALFGGGGIGWARNVSDVSRTSLNGGTSSERTDETDNFAWNLAAGAIWSFSRDWDLEFKYRYVSLGEVSSGAHTDGTTIQADSYTAHDVIIGITYRF